jgi:ubiquinone/menaquinone biosynthesis C-methylase UbiE
VRADRYEDISTLPSFEANCANEIYAGHVAEHVDDVKASFGRWFEVPKPGGRITITVPDCRGANRMWLERKRFPIIAITTGVKAKDVGDREKESVLHHQVFDESTLRICMEAAGFINIAPVDNHEAMVALLSAWLASRARRLQTKAGLSSIPCLTGLEYLLKESLDSNDQSVAIRTFVCVSFVDE